MIDPVDEREVRMGNDIGDFCDLIVRKAGDACRPALGSPSGPANLRLPPLRGAIAIAKEQGK